MCENKSLISVIITCYNYARFVGQAIESALHQTYPNIEVIVVNDGSTDESEKIIQKYLKDKRVKYIYQNNCGQAKSKNNGIKNSQGEYIAFLDADDFWTLDKLSLQIPGFESEKVGIVYSGLSFVDEFGNKLNKKLTGKYFKPRQGKVTHYLLFDNFIPFSSSVVRKEVLDKVGWFDESLKMGIDWDLWLRISLQFEFKYVDKPLLNYRVGHFGQMSKNMEQRFRNADDILKKFFKKNKDLITEKQYRKIMLYNYLNRANYYESQNIDLFNNYLKKAFRINPFSASALKLYLKKSLKIF